MKYKELIQFESVDEIIKFDKLSQTDYRERLVRTFVCSQAYENFIIPRICRELDLESVQETHGIQVVGNYGTGKSHLMSLFSIVAEDANYLELLSSKKAKESLKAIAGKYKVIRFEISGTNSLWEMVTYQIDKYLEVWGVDYSICDDDTPVPYYEKLEKMMAAFEEAYPDKGFMFVIDEMLSYLQGHAQPHLLGADLQVLQALGHMSDRTKFRMVFGVQELIYQAPEFQFASEMLSHVADRYTDLKIEKADVQFIVQERLLHKDIHQQQTIKEHLLKFVRMFPDINNNLETYVNLFPVHPSYFDNFQQIRVGKNQREVLKVLSRRFQTMLDLDVPDNEPGLICYDSYWEDMQRSQDLMAIPDVRKVAEITALVNQKIDDYFTGGRAPKKPLAHRIVAASAIKILQADLTKTNGVLAESLANDLCPYDATVGSFDELVDLSISTTLGNIVKATIGQYFERNEENLEYHLRIEGGINYKQNVINYAATMPDTVKDEYFFDFLAEVMPVDWEVYRPNFKIWQHTVNWKSHNLRIPGYIFMGNPHAKSTTQPKQHFYLYFMPIFDKDSQKHSPEEDGIFFLFDKLSDGFRESVTLYGASQALLNNANSVEKPNYRVVKDEYYKSAKDKFNAEFQQATEVEFGRSKQTLNSFNPQGDSKIDLLSYVASELLENQFCLQSPDYPKFTNLQLPMTPNNRANLLAAARAVITNPQQGNRNGEAILHGLGLWTGGLLSTDSSLYAHSLKNLLDARKGQVLNQSDILKHFYEDEYISADFGIEADLEFIVMAAMAQLGEIEIVLGDGSQINAGNIDRIKTLNPKDYYSFSHIAPPRGINIPLVRELSIGLLGQDRTGDLDNPEFYSDLLLKAQDLAKRAAEVASKIQHGYSLSGVEILDSLQANTLYTHFIALKSMCDQLQRYNSKAKLRNIAWDKETIQNFLVKDKKELEKWETLLAEIGKFQSIINYLSEAKQYVADNDLKEEMRTAIDKLGTTITKGDAARKKYMEELKTIQNKYADYYVKEYTAAHLPATEASLLTALNEMPERKACVCVATAVNADPVLGIINIDQFEDWNTKLQSVRIADPGVTKQAVLNNPYQGFNPVAASHKPQPNLTNMKVEMQTIHAEMEAQMKAALQDPTAQANKQMLTTNELSLYDDFVNGKIALNVQYAQSLLDIVRKLSTSFDIEEVTMDMLKTQFNRPLDVETARKAFSKMIDDMVSRQRQKGKNPDAIRIIIK